MPGQQQGCPKPLSKKVFYLDLPSSRRADSLEDDIKLLGGTVEKFFSKEIRYLVSNKREAKYVERLRRELGAHQPAGSHKDGLKPGSPAQADSVAASRGKSLVERVVKEQERIQMDKTLLNALEWGVKVLYIDDVITYVEKRKKQVVPSPPVTSAPVKKRMKPESKPRPNFPKSQANRITAPFIKVEDSSRHYRPLYAAMSKMPELNTETAPPCTPFCADKKDQNRNGHGEERGHVVKTTRDKKQAGFCECCMLQYDVLGKHVQSESHLAFSKGNEYLVLDRLISTMQCDLALLKPKTKRPKCSVSSTLAVPGPHGRELHKPQVASVTEKRLKPDRISTAAGGREPLNGLAAEPPPGSVQTSGANGNLRNPDRTSARPLPCHTPHTGGTDSLGDPTAAAGPLAQTPAPQVELAPPRGSASALDPATLCRRHTEDSQRGCSPRTPRSLQEGGGEGVRDCPWQCHHPNEPAPGEQETRIPACQGVHPHQEWPSPVTTIQRKVRVQKRKRQRVDTGLAVHSQVRSACDVPDYSLLCLWQLFHSSDRTDVE